MAQAEELRKLARARALEFPIVTKEEFVEQMTRSEEPVVFRGRPYDAAHVSRLIPDFFFPVSTEEDLVGRSLELLMARGMLPLPGGPAR